MKKRRYLIAVSLLLLLLSAGYGLTSLPESAKPGAVPNPASQQPNCASGKAAAPQLPAVNLSLLQGEKTAYGHSAVNLFRSLHKARAPQTGPSRPLRQPESPTAAEPAAEPPVPLPPPLAYLGQLQQGGRQTVFLRQDDEVFLVHAGERFGREQEFRVAAIYPDVLMLNWAGSDFPVYIPLARSSEGNANL